MSSWRASPFRYPVDPFSSEPSGVFSLSFSLLPPLALSLSPFLSSSLYFSFSRLCGSLALVLQLSSPGFARADPAASFALFLRRSLRVIGRSSLFFFIFFFISLIGDDRAGVDPRRVTGVDIDDLSLSLVILSHLFLVSKLVFAVPPDTVRLRRDQRRVLPETTLLVLRSTSADVYLPPFPIYSSHNDGSHGSSITLALFYRGRRGGERSCNPARRISSSNSYTEFFEAHALLASQRPFNSAPTLESCR